MVFHKGDHADNYSHWLIDKWELKKNTYSTEKTRIAHGYTLKYFCRFIESSAFDSQWGLGKNKLIKKAFQGQELDKAERNEITEILLSFQNSCLDRGLSSNTIHHYTSNIKAIFKRFHIDAYYDDLKYVRKNRKTKHGMKILTMTQMRDFVTSHKGFQLVALMIRLSTACRIGVFAELRFCDIIEYYDDCMKIRFYPDPENLDNEFTKDNYEKTGLDEYYGFLTPEASRLFRAWKKLIQEKEGSEFNENQLIYSRGAEDGALTNLANYGAKKLKEIGANKITKIEIEGLDGKKQVGKSDISSTHHTRKFVNTNLKGVQDDEGRAKLDHGIIEHWVMNHGTGLDDSYRIIVENKFFTEFKKMVPYLTINQIEALDIADRFKEESNRSEIESLRSDFNQSEEKRRADNLLLQQLIELYKQGLSYEEAMKKMKFPKNFYE